MANRKVVFFHYVFIAFAAFVAAAPSADARGLNMNTIFSGESSRELFMTLNTEMHNGILDGSSVSNNGKYAVTCSTDRTCKAWEVETGRLLGTLRVERDGSIIGMMAGASISDDGKFVVAPSLGPVNGIFYAYVFSVEKGRMVGGVSVPGVSQMLGKYSAPKSAFSPLGSDFCLGVSRTLLVVDRATLKIERRVLMPKAIEGIHYAADGSVLVYHATGYTVFDKNFKVLRSGETKDARIYDGVISPDGTKVAYLENSLGLRVVDIPTGKEVFYKDKERFMRARVSWDARTNAPVVYGLRDAMIHSLQPGSTDRTGKLPMKDAALEEACRLDDGSHLIFTPNGFYLLGTSGIKYRKVIPSLVSFKEDRGAALALQASEDGGTVLIAQKGGGGVLFDLKKNSVRETKKGTGLKCRPVYSIPGSSISLDKKQTYCPVINGKQVRLPFRQHVKSFSFLPNGDIVIGTSTLIICYSREGKPKWIEMTMSPAVSIVPINGGKRIISLYPDGCVRYYDTGTGRLLLSCFIHPDKKRWIMWTPEGFFDHSSGSEGLVGVHVNNGAGKEASYYSLDRFYDTYYRPDLVQYRLRMEQEELVAREAQAAGSVVARIRKGIPPKLSVACTLGKDGIKVLVDVLDQGGGVGPVEYFVNGTKVAEDPAPQGTPKAGARHAMEKVLPPVPGENVVEVRSRSLSSGVESKTAVARVNAEGTGGGERRLFVLVVGVDDYMAKDLRLRNAVNDARYLAGTLKDKAHKRFNKVVVERIENRKATRENILESIRAMGSATRPQDCFLLYLSGHGLTLDHRYHFLPCELTELSKPSLTKASLGQKALNDALLNVRALDTLIILDTCQSGSFAGDEAGFAIKTATGHLNRATGRSVLTAASSEGSALEGYHGHGLFTYVLVKGLSGEADAGPADKQVSLVEAGEYVTKQVPAMSSEAWGVEQRPVFYHRSNDYILTQVP